MTHSDISGIIGKIIESHGHERLDVNELVDEALDLYGAQLALAGDLLIRRAMASGFRARLRALSSPGDGQQQLPGMEIPRRLAVPDGETGRTVWVETTRSSWAEIEVAISGRLDQISADQASVNELMRLRELVRPYKDQPMPVQAWIDANGQP